MHRARGKTRHADRYGLSYWIWDYDRAITTPAGEPRTDDSGVIEQLRNIYLAIGTLSEPDIRQRTSIDVGAYIGVISLAMAQFGADNHTVHSFEADDLNFDHLKTNIASRKISPHNVALSDHTGTTMFTRNRDHGTNHLGVPPEEEGESESVYEVQVDSLDNFAASNNISVIDMVKIDVEGSDIKVLQGAENLLSSGRVKALVIELPLEEEGRSEMTNLLLRHGYTTAYIVRNSKLLIGSTETAYSNEVRSPLNMLAVTADIAAVLDFPSGKNSEAG
jgi:FkbM family methyltransferase